MSPVKAQALLPYRADGGHRTVSPPGKGCFIPGTEGVTILQGAGFSGRGGGVPLVNIPSVVRRRFFIDEINDILLSPDVFLYPRMYVPFRERVGTEGRHTSREGAHQ